MANPTPDSVKVAVRIRPLSDQEQDRGCRIVVDQPNPLEQQIVIGNGISGKPEAFTFNYAFSPDDNQEQLYENAVRPLLRKLYEGYNVTILAYGQTGSGKTFTMGTNFDGEKGLTMGVIPRAINDIFKRIETTEDVDVSISCSFMELYQETLYDLLSKKGTREERVVDIREANNQIVIPGLTEISIFSANDTFEVLMQGSQERAVASTAMNAVSSRSHAIFTINLINRSKGEKSSITNSKFHLVDLAGSERPKKTQATGERFKEGVKINQGLLVLGNVISALGSSEGPRSHVPYRESKLTRLLQDSLGGNSVTLMIACISPADYNCEETINTLRYANRAKNIRNKAVVNQDPNQAEIRHLNAVIQGLRMELLSATTGKEYLDEEAIRPSTAPEKYVIRSISENQFPNGMITSAAAIRREREMSEKIRTLQQQLQMALQDLATDQLRFISMEKLIEEMEALLVSSSESELKQKLQTSLVAYKEETALIRIDAQQTDAMLNSASEDFQNESDTHTQKQMKIRDELRQLTKELEVKEELHRKCLGNISDMSFTVNSTCCSSVELLGEYELKIKELEKQIEDLSSQLNMTKMVDKKNKLAEDRRRKVQQLEAELTAMRKKSLQQTKLLQMKEKDTQRVENLNREIQALKAMKVKLAKDARADCESFRQWKKCREKEIGQLRMKDRKLTNQMNRLQMTHTNQQNVLKRKVEEALAVNKRLKIALERQKYAQALRAAKPLGKFVRGVEIPSWIDHELELIRSVKHATVLLKTLMDDRALLNAKLRDMKNHPEEHAEQEIKKQEQDLDLRNAQIADIQQKLLSTDVDSKQKMILESILTLPEAKQAIKKLLSIFSETQEEAATIRHQLMNVRLSEEDLEESNRGLIAELAETKRRFADETNELAKMYEEKLSVLLISRRKYARRSQQTASACDSILQEANDRMEKLRQELDSMKEINSLLTKQLEQVNANRDQRTLHCAKLVPVEHESEEEDEGDWYTDVGESDLEQDPDFRATPVRKRKRSTSVREMVMKKYVLEGDPNQTRGVLQGPLPMSS
ncbi:chromosome-associated kinesin KIF4-like [Topomyia yanbarensis]|uniref:chromosome-associated kinesin KIF4-like n=1 Tax=Topomyia yanbarensis TaxID=2498891 RepID=UPI00273B3EF5|nr:chromosome-associated kinesin KIF4-like [Topomyia yanbarensis]